MWVEIGVPEIYVDGMLLSPIIGGIEVQYTVGCPNGVIMFNALSNKAAPGFAEVKLDFLNGRVDTYKDSEVLSVGETHRVNEPTLQRHIIKLGSKTDD